MLYYGYIGVIGLAVWAVLKFFKSGIALAQIWCTYGARFWPVAVQESACIPRSAAKPRHVSSLGAPTHNTAWLSAGKPFCLHPTTASILESRIPRPAPRPLIRLTRMQAMH